MLASVPSVLVLTSPVDMVCEVDLALFSDSVSDCEVVKPQFFPVSVAPALPWSVNSTRNESRHGGSASRYLRGRPLKAVLECLRKRAPPSP